MEEQEHPLYSRNHNSASYNKGPRLEWCGLGQQSALCLDGGSEQLRQGRWACSHRTHKEWSLPLRCASQLCHHKTAPVVQELLRGSVGPNVQQSAATCEAGAEARQDCTCDWLLWRPSIERVARVPRPVAATRPAPR
jgi:hypothetical protein